MLEKMGIKDVIKPVLKFLTPQTMGGRSYEAYEPYIRFDYLKTTSLKGDTSTIYIQGGRGNTKLLAFNGSKEMTIDFEDALISVESLALLTGGELTKGVKKTIGISERLIVTSGVPVTLKHTPVQGNAKYKIFVTKIEGGTDYGTKIADYTILAKALTVDTFEGEIMIDYYFETDEKVASVTIDAETAGKYFMLEGTTLAMNMSGDMQTCHMRIPKMKIKNNFEIALNSESASTFKFEADIFGVLEGSANVLVDLTFIEGDIE